jgi:hypothetical protein
MVVAETAVTIITGDRRTDGSGGGEAVETLVGEKGVLECGVGNFATMGS